MPAVGEPSSSAAAGGRHARTRKRSGTWRTPPRACSTPRSAGSHSAPWRNGRPCRRWRAGGWRRGHERSLTHPAASVAALPLARVHVARGGAPAIRAVDAAIFERRYFGHCMACSFCHDSCCQHGVDVSVPERDRILAAAEALAPLVRVPREQWFVAEVVPDADFPGGAGTRTAVVDGGCVFLREGGRGCALHAFALERGEDYHALKPMVSALFPVTFGDGLLCCSEELLDGTLICTGEGPTAYEMARVELGHYFGPDLVAELDAMAIDRRSAP